MFVLQAESTFFRMLIGIATILLKPAADAATTDDIFGDGFD